MANEVSGNATVYKLDPAAGVTYVTIANQLDATLTMDTDALEVTNKSHSNQRDYIAGNRGWSGTFNGHLTTDPALDLDGATEYAHVADHADFDLTDNAAIEVVFIADTVAAGTRYLVHKTDGSDGYAFYQTADELALAIDGATDGISTTTNANLVAGQLYIAKASFAAGTVKIYLNGTELTTNETGTIPAAIGVNATRLTIGADAAGANFFDGKLYTVAIDNAASANNQRLLPASCVGYWRFNGDLTDETSGAHTLTGVNIAAADYGDLTYFTIRDSINSGTEYTLQLAEDGTALTYTGTVIFTSAASQYPQNAPATYSVNFQGAGALTIA